MWHLVITSWVVVSNFPSMWICWINHGASSKQHERQKMLLCFGFYEVITLHYAHYPFATCCAYVCKMVIYYAKFPICEMHALNNVKPHVTNIVMMVRVLCGLPKLETWWLMFLFLLNSMATL
jgi:hypothetical protein